MKIGVAFPFSHRTSVEFIAQACKHFEEAGFDRLLDLRPIVAGDADITHQPLVPGC